MAKGYRGRSLREVAPDIAGQWHPTKNGESTPDNTSSGANRKAWWVCDMGHEWEAHIGSRANNAHGCPICSGLKILAGFNDLATLNPELASEWHPFKNEQLSAQEISGGTSKKVWWLGKCGHEWVASIAHKCVPVSCLGA